MTKSIIQDDIRRCYMCGGYQNLERHHVFFGTANRRLSEEDGMVIRLCHHCHQESPWAVHKCRETDLHFKRIAQTEWERRYGDREAFIARYGKNFLEEESI